MDETSTSYYDRVRGIELLIPVELVDVYEKLVRSWETFNENFFEGEMTTPLILLSDPGSDDEESDWIGAYDHKDGISYIGISTSLFHSLTEQDSPEFEEIKFKFIEDILIHEMVHQLIEETGAYDVNEQQYLGHGHKFAEVCNRVGEKIGLSPVYVNQRPYCFAWPDSVRRLNHYIPPCSRLRRCERHLVGELLENFAFNGPDGGVDPYGGGGVVRLYSTLAA